jgi:hypothetical protein
MENERHRFITEGAGYFISLRHGSLYTSRTKREQALIEGIFTIVGCTICEQATLTGKDMRSFDKFIKCLFSEDIMRR